MELWVLRRRSVDSQVNGFKMQFSRREESLYENLKLQKILKNVNIYVQLSAIQFPLKKFVD